MITRINISCIIIFITVSSRGSLYRLRTGYDVETESRNCRGYRYCKADRYSILREKLSSEKEVRKPNW